MQFNRAGAQFRALVADSKPLQIAGAINPYMGLQAIQAGFKSLYLSGGGVAAASFGIPDLGVTQMSDVLYEARRIVERCDAPLLVDIDVGWGGVLNIERTIRSFERAGVAAVHIEDQIAEKRCGHRPNKALVDPAEMVARIKAAVDARDDPMFVIMARTDALASEGLEAAVARIQSYVEAGADMIFAEAFTDLQQYQFLKQHISVPVLANMTEFGKTELFSANQLADAGVQMVLYPLSAFRSASQAALNTYRSIIDNGHQRDCVDAMQTRQALYETLDYYQFEQRLDQINESKQS